MDCVIAEPAIGLAGGEARWLPAMTTKAERSVHLDDDSDFEVTR